MPSPPEVYRERCERFGRERDRITVRWERVSNARLAVFLPALALLGWALWSERGWAWAGGFALLGAFVVLVGWQGVLGRTRQRLADLWAVNDEAIKRHARDWNQLPLRHTEPIDVSHPYAVDLDIAGRASLMHLLLGEPTPGGERTLRHWLLAPAPVEAVGPRQDAVAELADALEFRDALAIGGRRVRAARPNTEPFLAWAEGEPWLSRWRGLLWAARISPLLLWLFLMAQLTGVIPYPLWLAFLGANIVLYVRLGGRSYATLTRLWEQASVFGQYAALFQMVADASLRSAALRHLQAALTADGQAAPAQMRRLDRLSTLAIPRSAPLYWPIQLFTLWDIHAMLGLEGWQRAAGGRARGWLAALGEIEALAALAVLSFDNPEWTFPDVDPGARLLTARELAHPLLPADGRVANDVEVGPAGTFLLVTGSNMSGKSTLLRAIGVNLVLAGAGAPVCASRFRAPPVTLWTSMRVSDSLERGVSYFMAELQRLKQVVDASRPGSQQPAVDGRETVGTTEDSTNGEWQLPAASPAGGRTFFYLLDEILQGTNTAERQIAARRIIAYLVEQGALGAVSTHDLTLAEAAELAPLARMVHFTETIMTGDTGPAMTFDYRLRPGIATSTNALRLMEIVGLELGPVPKV